MQTVYKLNADELDNDFLESIKTLFRHKTIKVAIQEIDNKEEPWEFSRFSEIAVAENEIKRQTALAHIAAMKVNWQGKPIENRDALYDNARD